VLAHNYFFLTIDFIVPFFAGDFIAFLIAGLAEDGIIIRDEDGRLGVDLVFFILVNVR
jgi:hypothetical protein